MLTSICVTELKLTLLTRLYLGKRGGKNPEEDILAGVGGGGRTGWSLAPGGYSCQQEAILGGSSFLAAPSAAARGCGSQTQPSRAGRISWGPTVC